MENQINTPDQFKGKGALDAFLNLLSLVTVGWLAIGLGMVLFQIINKFLTPQAIDYVGRFDQEPLKFGIASVVILTPIFLGVSAWLHRSYKAGKLDHKSGIHRWLTYLMLFVSALTIIGRLIYQLFRFLDGDYATAVILKTLVILAIAGGIFGYYLYDLIRKDFSKKSPASLVAFILVVVVTLSSVICGFFIIDSPTTARAVKFDNQRVNDLYNLESMVNEHYRQNLELPQELSAVKFSYIQDPETGFSYDYNILGNKEFELCANFSLVADPEKNRYYHGGDGDKDWSYHQAGHQCFSVRVNEDEFKARLIPLERIEN